MLRLEVTTKWDPRLRALMERHYSKPKSFVGRSICYAVLFGDRYIGHTVAGSAGRFLPGRNEALGVSHQFDLEHVANNIFFHIEPPYPLRNFCSAVVREWMARTDVDWKAKYGDVVLGFESLVELPRTGDCYLRAGWTVVGVTKGWTAKRVSGKGTDSWTGRRVWSDAPTRPRLVLAHGPLRKPLPVGDA